jgi:glycosyltransferase involved in cell wall biosynthesis
VAHPDDLLNGGGPVKIAVYSPAKDEEHNVEGWYESALDADEIVLVDTGSTDNTVRIARDWMRVPVVTVTPWRFDDGFNVALAHVSADVDVCIPLHLDERLDPGWRKEIEKVWKPGVGRITFDYQWSPEISFRHDRIHARNHRWVGAAHEMTEGPGITVDSGVRIVQLPTERDRTVDSGLMELAYRENPNVRTTYYWARECFYRGRWEESRALFNKYLAMEGPDQERSEACRIVAAMVWPDQREKWLLRACSEAPQRRECWYSLAKHYYDNNQIEEAVGAAHRALSIRAADSSNSFFLQSEAWNDSILEAIIKEKT